MIVVILMSCLWWVLLVVVVVLCVGICCLENVIWMLLLSMSRYWFMFVMILKG